VLAVIRSSTRPWSVNLTAFDSRLCRICRSRCRSDQLGREAGWDRLGHELEALFRGQRPEDGEEVIDEGTEGKPLRVQLHLARLHPGQIEDVVDELQQVGP
jgi:hypothetical protein